MYLSPSDGLSLFKVSTGLRDLQDARFTLTIQYQILDNARERSQSSLQAATRSGNWQAYKEALVPETALQNQVAGPWRQTLMTRMAEGKPVPDQDLVKTLTSICQSFKDSGTRFIAVESFKNWPMHEVIKAVAQVAWVDDDVAEHFRMVVPSKGGSLSGNPEGWNRFEYRALRNAMSALHQLPVIPCPPQSLTIAFSSSPPAVGSDGKPESQTWSVEHTDRGTGVKSTQTTSQSGAEPEIRELNFLEANGRSVTYVHLFNHTGEPIPPEYGIVQ